MAIIKLENEMTKAELLATQNSNNGYNEMIVDDMVDSIPETGANALVDLWSGTATPPQTITLSESIYNFRLVFVRMTGAGTTIIVPIYPGATFFRGEGGHATASAVYSYQVNGQIVSPTSINIEACNLINLSTGNITDQTVSQLWGMR